MMVCVVVVVYNLDSRIFLLQMEAIKKFCTDDYEIHVFDNSYKPEFSEAIRYHCDDLEIYYTKTDSFHRNGSDSHVFALNLSYQMLKDKFDWFIYLDHDCIPIASFSVVDTLGIKLMAGVGQNPKHTYFWVGCLLKNTAGVDKELMDFKYSHELHLDSGGMLYKVVEKYGKENFIFFNESYCELEGFSGKEGYYTLINNGMFCHFVNASGWEPSSRHEERMNALLNIAKQKIDNA